MLLDRVDRRRGNQLEQRVPVRAAKTAAAAGALPSAPRLVVLDERLPCVDRVSVAGARVLPEIEQRASRVRVLHAERAVQIPGVRNPALAAARLVRRDVRGNRRVIERLHLPGDDAVLDEDLPAAPASTVHAVSTADNAVVLIALPIEVFPLPAVRPCLVDNPAAAHRAFPSDMERA